MIGPVLAGIVGAVLVALLPTRDERARWRANRATTIGASPETGARAFPGDATTIGAPSAPTPTQQPNPNKENPTP